MAQNTSVFSEDDINASFARLVSYLKKNNHIEKELEKELQKANRSRNKLIHDAMWQIGVIKETDVVEVKALKDKVAKALEKLKKEIKKK